MTDLTLFDDSGGDRVAVSGRGGSLAVHPPCGPGGSTGVDGAGGAAHGVGGVGVGCRRPVRPGEVSSTPLDGVGGVGGVAHGAGGRVAGRLEALLVGLRSLGGDLLEERLGLIGRCEAALAAVRSETVGELARRDGHAKAAEVVRDRLRQSRGSAKRDVQFAGRLADLAGTARALADGDITPQHARIIAEAAGHANVDETELLDAAATQPTDVFDRTARQHVNERSTGEDLNERRRRQRARRELSIKQQPDGMFKLFALLDPVAGARVETALDAAAKKIRHSEHPTERASLPQRYADALELLATSGNTARTQSTTLLVIAQYDAVAGRISDPRLPDGAPVTADELVKLAVGAKVVPAIFDTPARPLWLGRASRDANTAQRIALAARDGRCIGCGARHNICEPHHEKHWEHGGPTNIDNLCLLCGHCHHHQVHNKGAHITKTADGKRTLHHTARHQPPNTNHTHRNSTNPTTNQPLRL